MQKAVFIIASQINVIGLKFYFYSQILRLTLQIFSSFVYH